MRNCGCINNIKYKLLLGLDMARPPKDGIEPTINPKSLKALFNLMKCGESFTQSCEVLKLNKGYVWSYIQEHEEVSIQYAQAKLKMWNYKSDNIQDLVNVEPERDKETGKIDPGWVAYQRLKKDTYQWLFSKVLPKIYGNKVKVKGSGNVTINLKKFKNNDGD